MRSFKIIALTICFINLLVYLSASFYHASFDISTWSLEARRTIVFSSLFINFVIAGIILDTEAENER